MSQLLPMALVAISITAAAGLTYAQEPGGGRRPNLDANGDGAVSAAEFDASALQRFQRMDDNGDGVIDAAELAARLKRMEERRADGGAPARPRGGGLDEMDADKDGRITQAEALATSKARFVTLDKNGNGQLSADEQPPRWSVRP